MSSALNNSSFIPQATAVPATAANSGQLVHPSTADQQRKSNEADIKAHTSPLHEDEKKRRDAVLNVNLTILPTKDQSLKSIVLSPRDLVEYLYKRFGANKSAVEPYISDESAAFVKNSNVPMYRLVVEFPAGLFYSEVSEEEILTFVKNRIFEYLNAHIQNISPDHVKNKIAEEILSNYFTLTVEKQLHGTVCQARFGNNLQINFCIGVQKGLSQLNFEPINNLRVGVYGNWISYIDRYAIRMLLNRAWQLTNLSDPFLPCRKIIYNMRGFHFTNDKEVTAAALVILKLDTKFANYMEYRVRINKGDVIGRLVGCLNWIRLVQQLPDAEAKEHREAILERETCTNPLVAVLKDKSHLEVDALVDWMHGVLFYRMSQGTSDIAAFQFDHSPTELRPQLSVASGSRKRFVSISSSPLSQIQLLAKSWKALENMFVGKRLEELCDQIKRLNWSKIILTEAYRNHVLQNLVKSARTGRLSTLLRQSKESVDQVCVVIQTVFQDNNVKAIIWRDRLTLSLTGMQKTSGSKQLHAALHQLENIESITEKDIFNLIKLLNENADPALSAHQKAVLINAAMLLMQRIRMDSSLSLFNAVQKLVFILHAKKVIEGNNLQIAFEGLIEKYASYVKSAKEQPSVLSICEFLYVTSTWNKPKQYGEVAGRLSKCVFEVMLRLISEKSDDPQVRTKTIVQCAFTLLKLDSELLQSDAGKAAIEKIIVEASSAERKDTAAKAISFLPVFAANAPLFLNLMRKQQNPSPAFLQASQRLLIAAYQKKAFAENELQAFFEIVTEYYRVLEMDSKVQLDLASKCEFLGVSTKWNVKPKQWEETTNRLAAGTFKEFMQLLKSIKDNEKAVYQCLFALMQYPQAIPVQTIPEILEQLQAKVLLNEKDVKAAVDGADNEVYRNCRLKLLSILTSSLSNAQDPNLQAKIQAFALIEIKWIIRRNDDLANLKRILSPYKNILCALDSTFKVLEHLPLVWENMQKDASALTDVEFFHVFSVLLMQLDSSCADLVLPILFNLDVNSGLEAVHLLIAKFIGQSGKENIEKALQLCIKWVLPCATDQIHEEVALIQIQSLGQLVKELKGAGAHCAKIIDLIEMTIINNQSELAARSESLKANDLKALHEVSGYIFTEFAQYPSNKSKIVVIFEALLNTNLIGQSLKDGMRKDLFVYNESASLEDNVHACMTLIRSNVFFPKWDALAENYLQKIVMKFSAPVPSNLPLASSADVKTAAASADTKSVAASYAKLDSEEQSKKSGLTYRSMLAQKLVEALFGSSLKKTIPNNVKISLCRLLLDLKLDVTYFNVWKTISENYPIPNGDLVALAKAGITWKNINWVKHILELYERSGKALNLFQLFIDGAMEVDVPDVKLLTKMTHEVQVHIKSYEERCKSGPKDEATLKNNEAVGSVISDNLNCIFQYGRSVFMAKALKNYADLAQILVPLIQPAQHYVKKYHLSFLPNLNRNIVVTCYQVNDIEKMRDIARICANGPVDLPPGMNVQMLIDYLNRDVLPLKDRWDISPLPVLDDLEEMHLANFHKGLVEATIDKVAFNDITQRIEQINSMRYLRQIRLAFKVTKILIVYSREKFSKEADKKCLPFTRLLAYVSGAVYLFNDFTSLREVDTLAREIFKSTNLTIWNGNMIALLGLIADNLSGELKRIGSKIEASDCKLIKPFEELIPLYNTYDKDTGQQLVVNISEVISKSTTVKAAGLLQLLSIKNAKGFDELVVGSPARLTLDLCILSSYSTFAEVASAMEAVNMFREILEYVSVKDDDFVARIIPMFGMLNSFEFINIVFRKSNIVHKSLINDFLNKTLGKTPYFELITNMFLDQIIIMHGLFNKMIQYANEVKDDKGAPDKINKFLVRACAEAKKECRNQYKNQSELPDRVLNIMFDPFSIRMTHLGVSDYLEMGSNMHKNLLCDSIRTYFAQLLTFRASVFEHLSEGNIRNGYLKKRLLIDGLLLRCSAVLSPKLFNKVNQEVNQMFYLVWTEGLIKTISDTLAANSRFGTHGNVAIDSRERLKLIEQNMKADIAYLREKKAAGLAAQSPTPPEALNQMSRLLSLADALTVLTDAAAGAGGPAAARANAEAGAKTGTAAQPSKKPTDNSKQNK